jgi:outer membrane protein OmpA-like peptidoglycan-associated protein
MSVSEKREVERSSNVLIVNFRQFNKSREYLLGVANNYSQKGLSFETERLEYNPGEVLELILKHPYSELSVAAVGEIVWKIDGWYKCITGIKLKEMDQETIDKMNVLMTNAIRVCDGPPVSCKEQEISGEEDKEDIAVFEETADETVPEAAIMPPNENTLSVPDEENELPAVEKAEINIYRSWILKSLIKIRNNIGLLLITFYALFTVIVLMLLVTKFDNIEKIQQSKPSQKNNVIRQFPPDKGSTGPGSTQDAVKPVNNTKIKPENIRKAEKPEKSENTPAVRQPPLQRGEIKFDSDSDVVRPVFLLEIDKFAKALLKEPGAMLKVEGYADSVGPELYNLDLAMRRALGVKKLLMKKGINERRIKVAVYGESYPVSSNMDEYDNAGDRRVVMVMVPSGRISAAP